MTVVANTESVTTPREQPGTITIYHSPDADDAFMFYGLVSGNIDSHGLTLESALCDIESLNHRALKGTVDVTAISVHALAYCAADYAVLRCGASMGGADYGPRLVTFGSAKELTERTKGAERMKIACPGELTSATLALKLYFQELGEEVEIVQRKFDQVQECVRKREVDAGLIIHEGQLTLEREGFEVVTDLGQWWWNSTGLPLPLGVNAIKKTLGREVIQSVANSLLSSIEYGLRYREEALQYALSFGRGLELHDADEFVGMYVNDRTRDIGEDGIESIQLFLKRGADSGFIPRVKNLEFI